jgi:hypothetical protein
MKQKLFLISVWLVAITLQLTVFYGCDCGEIPDSKVGEILKGEHYLHSLEVVNDEVIFVWDIDSATTVKSFINVNKLRVVNENVYEPYIKFKWKSGEITDLNEILNDYVIYMEIHCQNSFFKITNGEYVKNEPEVIEDENPQFYTDQYSNQYD